MVPNNLLKLRLTTLELSLKTEYDPDSIFVNKLPSHPSQVQFLELSNSPHWLSCVRLIQPLHDKMTHITRDIEAELEKADHARQAGNEGRARVCARRAAGMAARDFLVCHGAQMPDRSAYAALQRLAEYPGLAPDLRIATLHLTMRLTGAFALPVEADLLADARKLIGGLD